jgi:hypothetical protein
LPAFVDVDVLTRNFLLTLAPVFVEGFQKRDVGARELELLPAIGDSAFFPGGWLPAPNRI